MHKLTGEDRVWRFSATSNSDHTHFNCTDCGQIYCLENLTPAVALNLPEGFELLHADGRGAGALPPLQPLNARILVVVTWPFERVATELLKFWSRPPCNSLA